MITAILTVGFALALLLVILRVEGDESIGYGATLEINDGASSAFVEVPKLEKLGFPNETTGTAESKTLDLPEAVIRKLPTLKDGGSFTFTYEVLAETYERVETIRKARSIKEYRVTVPVDTGTIEVVVKGFISANQIEDIEAEKITVGNVTVVVSGPQVSSSIDALETAAELAPTEGNAAKVATTKAARAKKLPAAKPVKPAKPAPSM